MPKVNIGNTKLYFEIYGSEHEVLQDKAIRKPTLVVLHGGPGIDHNYYDVSFLAPASKFAQVIFINHRGNGQSIDLNKNHWNLRQWATDVHDFCMALSLDKPFICGGSMGGFVAQLYASMYPKQSSGIILVDTEAYTDLPAILNKFEEIGGPEIRKIAYDNYYNPSEEVMRKFFEKCVPLGSKNPIPLCWLDRTIPSPDVSSHFKKELVTFNIMNNVSDITAPVLYLTNTSNPWHLYESAQKTANAMINTEVKLIAYDDCGIVAVDKKEEALKDIEIFIKEKYVN